ncbi:MAG: hydantoinase B/oxoprolinase family protein, partial [Actinomycetota bacterium]
MTTTEPGIDADTTTPDTTTPDTARSDTRVGGRFDPIELEICWQSLVATVNEQAKALQRSAFSPIVREAGDLANAVFDRRGRMVAQAVTGTPGHINSLAKAVV